MADFKRLGEFVLFEKEFECSLFTSWRAGELSGGNMEEHVRLDILSPDLCKNANLTEHWLGHSVSAAKLDHPNLLKERTAVIDGNLVVIYPYQESYCMEQMFQKSKTEGIPFSVDHALLIAGKMAAALGYASNNSQPHALALPAFVNVSAEGDLKMRGFAISHGLRQHLSAHPELMSNYNKYFPRAEHLGDGGLERYAVFAVGALLFEMLTGEAFYAQGKVTDARMRVSEAEALSTDGPIPDAIADIICKAIDPHTPKAFSDTQVLNTELEQLLFSGEYSPTTFNLAFFMHSAFRDEVEKRVEAMKGEKAINFNAQGHTPPPAVSTPAAASGQTQSAVNVTSPSISQAPGGGKSNKGLLYGLVAVAVIVIGGGIYFFMNQNKSKEESLRLEQQKELLQRQVEAKKKSESLQDNRKDLEIQLLKEKYKAAMEQMIKENARLDEQMKEAEQAVDEKAKALQAQIEEQKKAKEDEYAAMQEKIKQLEKEKEEQAKKREADLAKASEEPESTTETGGLSELPPETAGSNVASPSSSASASNNPAESVSTTTSKSTLTPKKKPAPVEQGPVILPYSQMDNSSEIEHPLNAQNFYTPSRQALRAGILTEKYYAYSFTVVINENGEVSKCNMDLNPLADLENDYGMKERATDYAEKLKFQPPIKNGLPSKCKKLVLIHFRIL